MDPISKRVKEIATVSLVQLCWFRAHYCMHSSLFLGGDGKISISLNSKLVIWNLLVSAREISELEKIWIIMEYVWNMKMVISISTRVYNTIAYG